MSHPIPDSYWVEPGRLLAGEYPGARYDVQARAKLRRLLGAGVTLYLDLTEPSEYGLRPYAPLLQSEAAALGLESGAVEHRRMSIPDLGTPSPEHMSRILDAIDAALEAGHVVYVHCYGGIGRTGTVVGCYMVRRGLPGQAALDEIARLRHGTPDGWRRSPETAAQRQMVRDWPVGDDP
jgi:hypothetical protein